jgi:mono/diheme cytochrome c family protein
MLVTGVALVVVGLVGAAVATAAFYRGYGAATLGTGGSSGYGRGGMMRGYRGLDNGSQPITATTPGASIYRYGIGSDGPVVTNGGPTWLGRMGGGCILCHGPDGRGGTSASMMGRGINPPDIRYSTLTAPRKNEAGEGTTPGWTEADIARVVREGIEPNGETVERAMPNWDIGDADMVSLIDYLKELDSR